MMWSVIGLCSFIGAQAEFGHNGAYANRFTADKSVVADVNVVADNSPATTEWGGPRQTEDDVVIGCCRGIDSACSTTSESTCEKNARRKGCEWLWGSTSSPPDCSDPTPEPGCCAGPSDACYDASDDAACTKLARRSGCEWRAGKDADCTPTTSPPGCCYGTDSKCWDADESMCYKNAKRSGCEWRIGTNGAMPDCTPPTPEPGCCAGEAACQVTWLDEDDCNKLSRREGCEWRAGKDADCTPTTTPPGCCYGESTKCHTDDQSTCLKMASRAGCEWRTDTADAEADCTPPTPEPGCCYGDQGSWSTVCMGSDEVMCNKLARRSGCEWVSGSDCPDEPTTKSPTTTHGDPTTSWGGPATTHGDTTTWGGPTDGCSTDHRHRVSWQETTETNRQLYINGFKTLANMGVMYQFTQCHLESSEHSNHEFLPWHREFVYRLENAIRALGGEYSCFTLPYWDWTMEPTPYDVSNSGEELFILNSGLGGDGDGECLSDDVWGAEAYTPNGGNCLVRDLDYPDESGVCTFWSASQIMEVIDWSNDYAQFRPMIEGTPHALPHVCIGGDVGAHMATYYSPDDPIFYLHHTFVDFIWAVWQDCNNYDGVDPASDSLEYADRVNYQLSYSPLSTADRAYPKVSETFDIQLDYDVSYEMGAFWENARVSARDNCAAEDNPINDAWFYNTVTALKVKSLTYSQSAESAIIDEVFEENPDASYEENIAAAADEICVYREHAANLLRGYTADNQPECAVSQSGLNDCGSDEDAISLDDIVNQPGLSQCAVDQRTRMFAWAEMMEQKQYLCRGCYDPYCDADSKAAVAAMDCAVNTQAPAMSDSLDWSAMALLETARNGLADNLNVVVMGCALLMLLAAKACLDRGEMSKKVQVLGAVRQEAGYGTL